MKEECSRAGAGTVQGVQEVERERNSGRHVGAGRSASAHVVWATEGRRRRELQPPHVARKRLQPRQSSPPFHAPHRSSTRSCVRSTTAGQFTMAALRRTINTCALSSTAPHRPSAFRAAQASLIRAYATHTSTGSGAGANASAPRKQISVTSDDGRVRWSDLSAREKAARTTQQSINLLVVLAGVAMTVLPPRTHVCVVRAGADSVV